MCIRDSQGKRVENDFRNAGYEDVIVDAKGYFEDWVQHMKVSCAR